MSVRTIARLALLAASLHAGALFAQTKLVVVSGLAGEPRYGALFHQWSQALVDAARTRHGLPDSAIVWLGDDPARAPGRIVARSTREALGSALASVATRMGPRDRLLLVFIGHGSAGEVPRLALPGPDVSASELARMLAPFGDREVGVVIAASASGDFVPALAGKRRVVITATKSTMEGNESLFGGHFVAAFAKDGADTDKDGRVSLLEAFAYATAEVRRVYDDGGRLLTEHALLDDDGDGRGSGSPGSAAGDGALARGFVLEAGRAVATAGTSALDDEKRAIEQRIETLRGRKPQMETKTYEDALEALLLQLADVTRRLRQGGRP